MRRKLVAKRAKNEARVRDNPPPWTSVATEPIRPSMETVPDETVFHIEEMHREHPDTSIEEVHAALYRLEVRGGSGVRQRKTAPQQPAEGEGGIIKNSEM